MNDEKLLKKYLQDFASDNGISELVIVFRLESDNGIIFLEGSSLDAQSTLMKKCSKAVNKILQENGTKQYDIE